MQMVWDTDLPQTRKMVLLSLADQANDQGECYPSFETIQKRCSTSRRTLFECLADLEGDELLARVRVSAQRVIFRLNLERLAQLSLPLAPSQCGSRTGAPAAPVRQPHRSKAGATTAQKAEPVRQPHQCASRTGALPASTSAPAALNQCASRTSIKQPPLNPQLTQGEEARALRQDEFNRLPDADQRLIDPFMSRLPLGISLEVFARFVKHRAVSRRTLSMSSYYELIREFDSLGKAGHELNACLSEAMKLGLSAPVAPRAKGSGRGGGQRARANDDFSGATYESTNSDELPAELQS